MRDREVELQPSTIQTTKPNTHPKDSVLGYSKEYHTHTHTQLKYLNINVYVYTIQRFASLKNCVCLWHNVLALIITHYN